MIKQSTLNDRKPNLTKIYSVLVYIFLDVIYLSSPYSAKVSSMIGVMYVFNMSVGYFQ